MEVAEGMAQGFPDLFAAFDDLKTGLSDGVTQVGYLWQTPEAAP